MIEITLEDVKVNIVMLIKNIPLIALFTIMGLCIGMLYSARQQVIHTYSATATVSVVFTAGVVQGQIPGTVALASYAEIVTTARVAEYAAVLLADESITAWQVQRMISMPTRASTNILRITARGSNPRHTILVANAVAESFVSHVSVITGSDSIQLLDVARTASLSASGGGRRFRLLAPAAAFAFASFLVVLAEFLSDKLRSVKQCSDDTGELLAVIPKAPKEKSKL